MVLLRIIQGYPLLQVLSACHKLSHTKQGLPQRPVRHQDERRILDSLRQGEQLFPELTTREREILDLMAAGKPNGDIARQLFISPKTVRNNISSIFAKLQVADRAHAIIRARSAGLGSGDS